jgi:hypothetical protein
MNLNYKLIAIVFLLLPVMVSSQSAEKWRNKNWKPKKGRYFFNKVLTWQYTDEMSEDDDFNNGVDISIYVDEKTGTFLFTPEAYVNSGPMTDFVIADRKGNYTIGYSLEHDGFVRETILLEEIQQLRMNNKKTTDNFNRFLKLTGRRNIFGENLYGWPVITGDECKIVFPEMDEEPTVINIATMPFSFLPVYMFNSLSIEAQLPFHFDYSEMIPENNILLSEYNEYHGRKTELMFKYFSNTEYYIDLKKYKKKK